jgi:hypothetical protein
MRRAARQSVRAVSSNPVAAARREKSWSRRGMDEKKIVHPVEVVRDLGSDVPERGGRRTMNVEISV